jgi:hypothetical protein
MNARELQQATVEARKELERIISSFQLGDAELLSWLKDCYATQEGAIAYLRASYQELTKHVLAWRETQQRQLTVKDARLLGCCRICRGADRATQGCFRLDYGEEHAHEDCLVQCGEAVIDCELGIVGCLK